MYQETLQYQETRFSRPATPVNERRWGSKIRWDICRC